MAQSESSPSSIGTPQTKRQAGIGREIWAERGFLREAVLAGILSNLTALVLPLFVMTAYDKVVPNLAYSSLWALALGVLLAASIDVIARRGRAKLLEALGTRVDLRLGRRLLSRMLSLPYVMRPKQLGEVSAGFRELESLRGLLSNTTLTVLVDLPFAALFIVIIALISPWLALPALVALPVLVLIAMIAGRLAAAHQPAAMDAGREQSAALVEGFAQYETIKSLALEPRVQARWESATAERSVAQDRTRHYNAMPSYFASAVSMVASVAVVVIGAYLVADQAATMGALIAAMILTGRAVAPAAGLAGLINGWHRARQAFASVSDMLSGEIELGTHQGTIAGQWQLDGVEVSYPDSAKPSLHAISLTIQPGERIAVLGRGGSGKTTLARVLAGLIVPERGLVKLDQVEMKQWSNQARAEGIGYLPQQPGFFAGSVRDNVLWGLQGIDEARLQQAAELSGLSRFLADWAAGWDQNVGEGGGALSGSQRTAVALARLIMRDTPVVVMDEPTSNLDARSEVELRGQLKPWLDIKGLILVTHRSAMLSWVDRIIVVDGGRIVADGPKDEVLTMLMMKQAQA